MALDLDGIFDIITKGSEAPAAQPKGGTTIEGPKPEAF